MEGIGRTLYFLGADMADKDEEPGLWVTVLKLVLIATAFIGGTGLVLWYLDKGQVAAQPGPGSGAGTGVGSTGWGIVGDSPLRPKR
jgi:hypothetical protein